MIIIAIVRVSSLRALSKNIDVQWLVFWQELEASVAVIMVSITAFRSLLGINALKQREKKARFRYWYQQRLLNNESPGCEELSSNYYFSAPGATLTRIQSPGRAEQDPTPIALTGRLDPMKLTDFTGPERSSEFACEPSSKRTLPADIVDSPC